MLSESDIRFLIETVNPHLMRKFDTIKGDPAIIEAMLDQEVINLFQRIMYMSQESMMTTISPRLLFEILLRKAIRELEGQTYTVERAATHTIPIFDARKVVHFFKAHREILRYLAVMLSAFTKVEGFTYSIRVRKGIWRKIRFSEMDFESILRCCEITSQEHRFSWYKRLADLCLFILGIFPEYVSLGRCPANSEDMGTRLSRKPKMSARELEEEGKRFYKLAGEHRDAKLIEQGEVFGLLYQDFDLVRKPLNHISDNYLCFKKHRLFPSPPH